MNCNATFLGRLLKLPEPGCHSAASFQHSLHFLNVSGGSLAMAQELMAGRISSTTSIMGQHCSFSEQSVVAP